MSAPDVTHSDNGQGTSSGSRRTPVHHGEGSISRTPSLTVSESTGQGRASASRGRASASRGRGKAIATPEVSDEEDDNHSSDSDYRTEISLDQLFDAPHFLPRHKESRARLHHYLNSLIRYKVLSI